MGNPQTPSPTPVLDTNAPATEYGTIDPLEPHDAEKLTNIRQTQPGEEHRVGRDSTGQGQPGFQKVKQEESLPATAVPVEKNFTKTGEFVDPLASERIVADKNAASRGAAKTE